MIIGKALTVDHKPDNIIEKDRIIKAGGKIMKKSGIHRVVWKRPLHGHNGPIQSSTPMEHVPFLAVARALGIAYF